MNLIDRQPCAPRVPRAWDALLYDLNKLPATGTPTQAELQARANHFLSVRGIRSSGVTVKVTDEFDAHAMGGSFDGVTAWGEIVMGRALMRMLKPDEIDFVLAHEVIHITENHVAHRLPFAAVRGLYEVIAIEEPGVKLLLAGFDLWKVVQQAQGNTPPAEALTKEQELQADAGAVRLTGKKGPAVSALTKLVGGDMQAHSHTWEALTVEMPIMTMGDRLRELHKTFPGWR